MLNLSLYSLFVITSIMTVATPGPRNCDRFSVTIDLVSP